MRERPRGGRGWWRRSTARACEIVDGATGAGGLGCLVVAAARAAEAGEDADAVVRAIHDTHERLDIWFCLDTLEYLRRGGRIGAAQALVGSALQIKPILTFGTEIAPVGRVRTRKRAFERMVAYLERAARARRDRLVRPARPAPTTTPSGSSRDGTGSSAPSRCSAPRWARCSATHLGSGMLVGGRRRG